VLVVLRRFDHDEVIGELDQDAERRAPGQKPDAVGDLLDFHSRRRRCRARCAAGDRERGRAVRLHLADRHVERRMPALPLDDSGRKLHTAEILVVRIGRVDDHVAEDRVGNAGFDVLDQVPIVDDSAQRVLAERRERHGVEQSSADCCRVERGGVRGGRLEKPVRRHPDLQQPDLGPCIANLCLGLLARNRPDAALTRCRIVWSRTTAVGRILDVYANELFAHRWRVVVDGGDVLGHLEARPWRARAWRLTQGKRGTCAGVLNRLQDGGAHRPGRSLDDGGSIDGRVGALRQELERRTNRGNDDEQQGLLHRDIS
jgi:hypothetical protein